MKEKRGQAAMEFLMTYGWAILVVLIAIGALAYFGVLNPDRFLGEKCTISTGSGLFCDDYNAVNGTPDTINVVVRNILTNDVEIQPSGMEVVWNNGANSCANSNNYTTGNSGAVPSDDRLQIILNTTGSSGPCVLESKDKIKGDITITYNTVGGGLPKTTQGSLVTSVP